MPNSCKSNIRNHIISNQNEALKNIKEAIELYLEPEKDDLQVSEKAEILEIAL